MFAPWSKGLGFSLLIKCFTVNCYHSREVKMMKVRRKNKDLKTTLTMTRRVRRMESYQGLVQETWRCLH
jgi:hypothetical protein